MGGTDAASGEDEIIGRAQGLEGGDDLVLDIADHAHLPQVDARAPTKRAMALTLLSWSAAGEGISSPMTRTAAVFGVSMARLNNEGVKVPAPDYMGSR